MKIQWKQFVAAGLAAAVLGAGMATGPAYADAVKDRQSAMKNISKANKVLVAYSKGKGSRAAAVAAANQIASIAKDLPGMFPKGSGDGYGKTTRAKAAIWTDWAKFEKAADALGMAAGTVAKQMGSDKTLMAAAGSVRKACGGCHKPFRGPKLKK